MGVGIRFWDFFFLSLEAVDGFLSTHHLKVCIFMSFAFFFLFKHLHGSDLVLIYVGFSRLVGFFYVS